MQFEIHLRRFGSTYNFIHICRDVPREKRLETLARRLHIEKSPLYMDEGNIHAVMDFIKK
jgi:hypothetical protein